MNFSKPDHERDFFRFLLPEERFTLQGFPAFISSSFNSQALQIKAAGNAYPVPLIAAAVAGLLEKIGPDDLPHINKALEDQPALRLRLEAAMFARSKRKTASKQKKAKTASSVRKRKTAKHAPKEDDADGTVGEAVTHHQRPLKRPASASASSTIVVKNLDKRGFKDAWRLNGFLSSSSSSS